MVTGERSLHEGFATVRLGGEPWRVFATRGAEHDVQVYVGESLHSRGAILMAVLRGTLWPLAVGLPLLALAVGWAVHGGLRPLHRLGRELSARAPAALSPVSVDGAPAEMRPMLDALNGLFTRIAALVEGERRFTADAAHELRTPIAAIRAQAQVALGANDELERRHALQQLMAGCDRATRLVAQLLVLARLESTPDGAHRHGDVVAVARRLLAECAPAAAARHQTVALEAPATRAWPVDETLMSVLLRNLLDNALRYGAEGAELRVTVAADGPLTIEDSGPGLDDAAIARLGQRFFRSDPSGPPGSGLGWSIVRRIAEREALDLRVDRSPDLGGLRVQLQPRQKS
jgi:two-component system, OmpR family, sensor histidine kinase QseC